MHELSNYQIRNIERISNWKFGDDKSTYINDYFENGKWVRNSYNWQSFYVNKETEKVLFDKDYKCNFYLIIVDSDKDNSNEAYYKRRYYISSERIYNIAKRKEV